ncbi:MAG: hypothetical protein LH645_13420 [Actinomycetia bacterium]|nr:hypothetical protein [Actinomycetes bacterium]
MSELWRPGGQYNPTAQVNEDDTGDWHLFVTSYGSGSCPFVPSSVSYPGRNQLAVDTSPYAGGCTADLQPSTESIAVDQTALNPALPITVTLNGLYSAAITVPVDASRVDARASHAQTLDLDVALVDMGRFGTRSDPTLVTYRTTVPSTGDIGWDAANALLTTVALPDTGLSNGWNIG